ncbi:DNRLRE domain-containing protein [Streptomyces sp. ME02-8801-2C]|uniref:DNRLRE domain-containing protein n=1 Tax=Streptomyces sp. ME02-8801-2C TaxID=3028680 RepID=UPI0029AB1CFE|nr:DNRLRE domain-containing protein [Streptomyces sp. ME02-8801-2C]MDX3458824.1 DNRLRE domain-containing protein [Streptomyces sp. ME02-8801-2C]
MAAEAALAAVGTGQTFAAAVSTTTKVASAKPAKSAASSADSAAAALLMARLQGRKIEVLSERSASSTTYALPNGQMQTSTYAAPIRQRVDGVWRNIDTALSDEGSALEPEVAVADIAVSDGGDTALASVTKGAKSFGMGWESKLPTPSVKDDTASYDLGGGETLTVTALSQGFSQNVVLDQAPEGPLEYRIPMRLKGLVLSVAESGHLLLKDNTGKLVAEAPAPMMWDSSKDRRSGESKYQARVATKVETAEDGSQTLVLAPDAGYFTKNKLTYPVTVDPTSTLAATTDTWVATNFTDSQVSSDELKSGTYDAGTTKARSYLKFDVSAFKGKHITDTNLALYSYYSSTCATTGAGTEVRRITGTWSSSDITWGDQPATTTTGAVTSTAAKGYSDSCPAGTVNFDVDAIVQAWADGSTNYGVRIAGASETDSTTWRRYRSANYVSGDGSTEPHLTVTYNSYATSSSSAISPSALNAYNGKRYVTSLTPTLTSKVSDADGSTVRAQYEITADPDYADTTYSYTAYGKTVASGSTSALTVPSASAFPAGAHLRYRVRAYDGADNGSWSGYTTFVLNTAKPVAPTVTCDTYGENTWTAKADEAVTCTLDTSSTDGQGYEWGLDDPSVPERVDDTTDGTGGNALTVDIDPAEGWHTLYARTVDSGGNLSTTTTAYTFGVGDGAAVVAPKDGITTARRVTLQARGLTEYTGATWYYRLGEDGEWTEVPVADATAPGGAAVTWPATMSSGLSASVVWNVADTVGVDTDLQVRAYLTGASSSGYSSPVSLSLDRAAGQGPAKQIGPGSVNLLTGTYTLTETDVDTLDVEVVRTAASRTTATDEPESTIFGPGWAAGHYSSVQDAVYAKVVKQSATAVQLVGIDGETTADFTYAGGVWTSADTDGVILTGTTTGSSFTLTDENGSVATYALSATAGTWLLDTVAHLDDDTEVSVSEAVFTGDTVTGRPLYVITSAVAGGADDCHANMTGAACRILEYVYASSTTATDSAYGDFTGQVSRVLLHAANPGATQTTSTAVAAYSYDTSGRLRQAWDPRISPALKTAYGYDSAGRVASYIPPGRRAWNFTFGLAGDSAAAGQGMLTRASRASADGNPDTGIVSLVYDVPLSGSSAPQQMASSNVATWGQQTTPVDATAVFPPDSVPAGVVGSALDSDDYARAEIAYTDAEGRELNAVTPGGHITTKEYDNEGNVVNELTAANRELALGTASGADTELALLQIGGETTRVRAERLSTVYGYNAAGLQVSETGPLHVVRLQHALGGGVNAADLAAGEQVPVRRHTTYAYDEGRPTDAVASDLVTTTTVGAQVAGYPTDGDITVTTAAYDWATGHRTRQTVDPTGLALATTTTYTAAGLVNGTTVPGGTTATTSYWTGTSGACGGHPEWTGLVCRTTTGTSGSATVTRETTYDRWGNPATVTETSGSTTRTTTHTYDAAGRLTLTHTTSGTGTALADQAVTYDTATGLKATVTRDGKTAAYTYDGLGRLTQYADGTGNTTVTAYDFSNRPTSVTDSAPGTSSYAYSTTSTGDKVVTMTDSAAGTFTFTYGADDRLVTQTLASGNTLEVSYDEIGLVAQRLYEAADGTPTLLSAVDRTIGGTVAHEARTAGTTVELDYTYDKAGRLTVVDGNDADTTCSTRAYALDTAGNRTGVTTTTASCADSTTATTTTESYAYNALNQLAATGYTYDAFGAATALADGTALAHRTDGSPYRVTLGANRETWTPDAEGRLSTALTESSASGSWATTTTVVSHYADGTATPAWSTDGTTKTRYLKDPQGNLVATVEGSAVTLALSDVRGDTAVTLGIADGAVAVHSYTDTGVTGSALRYGWLGGTERADRRLTGVLLIGEQLYAPSLGRYLTPAAARGDEEARPNAYLFASQDLTE